MMFSFCGDTRENVCASCQGISFFIPVIKIIIAKFVTLKYAEEAGDFYCIERVKLSRVIFAPTSSSVSFRSFIKEDRLSK